MLVRPAAEREAVGDASDTLCELYDDGREAIGESVERECWWTDLLISYSVHSSEQSLVTVAI